MSYTENVIASVASDPRADKAVKQVFKQKSVLALIVQGTIPEFAEMSLQEIEDRIDSIDLNAPVSAYARRDTIIGDATEDKVEGEGNVNYDIRFTLRRPNMDEQVCQLFVDLEAQATPNPVYPIIKRAKYYTARMISAQLTDLSDHRAYNKVRKVCSIWICYSQSGIKDAITRISMRQESVVGNYKVPAKHLDLEDIVLVRVSNDGFKEETKDKLLKFLGTLLTPNLDAEPKIERLREFLPNNKELEKEVRNMSGFAEVWQESGRVQGIVDMCKLNSFSFETAIDSVLKLISGISREEAEIQVKKYWN